jgi:hypothetical protein
VRPATSEGSSTTRSAPVLRMHEQRALAQQAHAGSQRGELVDRLIAGQELQRCASHVHEQAAVVEQPDAEFVSVALVAVGHEFTPRAVSDGFFDLRGFCEQAQALVGGLLLPRGWP